MADNSTPDYDPATAVDNQAPSSSSVKRCESSQPASHTDSSRVRWTIRAFKAGAPGRFQGSIEILTPRATAMGSVTPAPLLDMLKTIRAAFGVCHVRRADYAPLQDAIAWNATVFDRVDAGGWAGYGW